MSDELKPCPFCGGQPRVKNWGFIQCSVCEAEGGLLERDSKNEDMAELWNTRPVEDALRAELEALRAKWGRIPWDAIKERDGMACQWFAEHPDEEEGYEHAIIRDWLHFDAPKEATE